MTTPEQIKHLIPQGETTIQFKLRSEDAYKMGVEMVAFSNTQGGMLLIGVNDKTGPFRGYRSKKFKRPTHFLSMPLRKM